MNEETFKKVMHYLDKIENVLDEIAISVGHPTMKEFFKEK